MAGRGRRSAPTPSRRSATSATAARNASSGRAVICGLFCFCFCFWCGGATPPAEVPLHNFPAPCVSSREWGVYKNKTPRWWQARCEWKQQQLEGDQGAQSLQPAQKARQKTKNTCVYIHTKEKQAMPRPPLTPRPPATPPPPSLLPPPPQNPTAGVAPSTSPAAAAVGDFCVSEFV